VWDTVDRETGAVVCVPNAPGPILHGIRGDDAAACRRVADAIAAEPAERTATFATNQGTDAHLADGAIGDLRDGAGYRVTGVVAGTPERKRGGHVHVRVAGGNAADAETDDPGAGSDPATDDDPGDGDHPVLRAVAFAPTGRFRDRVCALRPGDRVTLCGEHEVRAGDPGPDGTVKLEKFAVRDLVETEPTTPTCPECRRTMSSAGRGQGYRCDRPRDRRTADRPRDRARVVRGAAERPETRREAARSGRVRRAGSPRAVSGSSGRGGYVSTSRSSRHAAACASAVSRSSTTTRS